MTVSIYGQLCFGIVFPEDYEFPWDEIDHIEEWWFITNKELPPSSYDEREEFLKKNPLPVELVNYCSGDSPMWILAVPSFVMTSSKGYPEEINIEDDFKVSDEEVNKLIDFCKKYCKNEDNEDVNLKPKWCLSSFCE